MNSSCGHKNRIIVALIALLGTSDLLAEPDIFSAERVGNLYWNIGVGNFTPDLNSQFSDQKGKFYLPLAVGYRSSANLAWDLDLTWAHQTINTPSTIAPPGQGTFFQGTVDPKSSLYTEGFSGTVKYIFPLGRFEPYGGGGLGFYTIRFIATGQQLGFPAEFEEKSTEIGFHLVAGADFYLTDKTALGIEFRNLKVNTNLGRVVPGEIKAGGSFASLVLRFY